ILQGAEQEHPWEVLTIKRRCARSAAVRKDTGVVRQFAPFAEQSELLDRVETDDARLRQHLHLLFGVPARRVVEEALTCHLLGQEARQVEAIVKRMTLVGDQRDARCRAERPGGLSGGVPGHTAADDQQPLARRFLWSGRNGGAATGRAVALLRAPKVAARRAADRTKVRRRRPGVL